MTAEQCSRGASFGDLLDYWVGELDDADAARVEEHLFECAECACRLAEIATIAAGVADAVRGARIQTVITDALVNKLSRDGVRMRTYAPEVGKFIPCAIWPEDQLIVTRLKGDFGGYEDLTLVLKAEEGPELARVSDVPLVSGPREILTAMPAAQLRQLPAMRLRIILSGTREGREQSIGEYGLEHGGAMSRE
jgi:hypothetical protein